MVMFGPIFRSRKIIFKNLSIAFPNLMKMKKKILKICGSIMVEYSSEYMFMKDFRHGSIGERNINIKNQYILENVKKDQASNIISGHFNNFELMAMQIEKLGIDLAAVYRPLNNKFLNPLMESIERYICKKQIKKGISGTKELLLNFKKGTSIALMIDQSFEGIKAIYLRKKL